MESQEKYPFSGRLTDEFAINSTRSKKKGQIGQVVGESEDGRCYKVIWPGAKTKNLYHKSFIEKVNI